MKFLENKGYWRRGRFSSIFYCALILELITDTCESFSNEYWHYGYNMGWISPQYQPLKIHDQPLEIFCTFQWPIIIAAKVTNTSTSLTFQEKNKLLLGWPNVTRVNETTIRLCLDGEYQLDSWYICSLIVTKMNPSGAGDKGTRLWRLEDFDGQFKHECMKELARKDSHFLYLLAKDVPSSVCYEGLQNIKSNGYVNILDHLMHTSALSENQYELREIHVDTIKFNTKLVRTPSSRKCSLSEEYTIPYELINMKIADQILTLSREIKTSTSILVSYNNTGYLQQFPNWTCELEYRSEEDSFWHLLSCPIEKFSGDSVGILYNVTDVVSCMKYTFRFRVKVVPTQGLYWSPHITETTEIPGSNNFDPITDVGLFKILHQPNEASRTVVIYWRPSTFTRCRDIAYETEAFEVDAKGKQKLSQEVFLLQKGQTNWQARYSLGSSAYRFYISSQPYEERASLPPHIDVPSVRDEVSSSIFLYSIGYENNTVEYIWRLPKEQPDIVNITFFWYWNDEKPTNKIPNLMMHWTYLPPKTTKYRINFNFDIRTKPFRSFIGINTKHSSSGLIAPMQMIFVIPRHRISVKLPPLNHELMEISPTSPPQDIINFKRVVNVGCKFSANQYQKWLHKIVGNE